MQHRKPGVFAVYRIDTCRRGEQLTVHVAWPAAVSGKPASSQHLLAKFMQYITY